MHRYRKKDKTFNMQGKDKIRHDRINLSGIRELKFSLNNTMHDINGSRGAKAIRNRSDKIN